MWRSSQDNPTPDNATKTQPQPEITALRSTSRDHSGSAEVVVPEPRPRTCDGNADDETPIYTRGDPPHECEGTAPVSISRTRWTPPGEKIGPQQDTESRSPASIQQEQIVALEGGPKSSDAVTGSDTGGQNDPTIQKARTIEALRRLVGKHKELVQNHIDFSESIKGMRRSRTAIRKAETCIVDRMTEILGPEFEERAPDISLLLVKMQTERKEQERREQDCDRKAEELVAMGFEVGRLGDEFFGLDGEGGDSVSKLASSIEFWHGQNAQSHLGSERGSSHPDYSPNTREYLSLVGDRQLLEERLEDLQTEQAELETQRVRFPFRINSEEGDTLVQLDDDICTLKDQILKVEHALLSTTTKLESYPPKSQASPIDKSVLDFDMQSGNGEQVGASFWTSPPPSDPGLPPSPIFPETNLAESPPVFERWTDRTAKESDVLGFIDSWLLHHLRSSPSQQRLYRKIANEHLAPSTSVALSQRIIDTWGSGASPGDETLLDGPRRSSSTVTLQSTRNPTQRDLTRSISTSPLDARRKSSRLSLTIPTRTREQPLPLEKLDFDSAQKP